MKATVWVGHVLERLRELADESVDSIVTDPPYHLTTGKKGGTGEASVNLDSPYGRARVTTGFMGMTWDGGDIAHSVSMWREVLRVLKPGGHLLAFGGSRTYHRMAYAIENNHPTVKPIELMCYLVRLVTPKGGTVLDCFMGSGSTGIAAMREGMNFIGIEINAEYAAIAEKRIRAEAPMFNEVEVSPACPHTTDTPLFAPELQALPHSESTEEASSASNDL